MTLPKSVTQIDGEAFFYCESLAKIECYAEETPLCGYNAFVFVDLDKCVLYVPKTSIDKYKGAYMWKGFKNIKALPAEVVASGTCGDSLTWTLDTDGLLTIEGTGSMYDYENSPWKDMTVTTAVIGEGITTIGQSAFYGCPGLTSVTIPNSVATIGGKAFYDCSGLTSVVIPSSVTMIKYGAFYGCSALEKIEALPVTPPVCGNDVFHDVDINKCVLSVPETSIESYKAADGWKEFYNGITGIDDVAEESNVGVSASNGVITVTGAAANTVVEVYSISGTVVYRGTSNIVAVPSAGVYVVKVAGKTFKVNAVR